MTQRTALFPAGRRQLCERNKYSAAVASGGFLFVSGQVGSEDDGSPLTDPERKVKDDFWGEPPYPPLTGIGVTWLYGFHFELKVTARLPGA
jgi:hypothetical protein